MSECTCLCKKHVCETTTRCDPHCKCRFKRIHSNCKCFIPKSLKRLAGERAFLNDGIIQCLETLPMTLRIHVYGTLCYCSWPPNGPTFFHVECLRYALSTGMPLQLDTLKSLACLRYAVEECGLVLNEPSFYEKMCYIEKFDMFKYAYENGCPWSENVSNVAASSGLYDFLVYAHQNGCPWNYRVVYDSYLCGHADCVTYAHDHMQDCSPYIIKSFKNVKYFLQQSNKRGKFTIAFILLVRVVWKKYIMSWF